MGGDRAETIRSLLEEFWRADWERLVARFSEEAVYEDPLLPEAVRGREAIRGVFEYCHAWSKFSAEVRTVFAAGVHAAAEFQVRGTVTAPLGGLPDAVVGAPFEFGETDVFEFDDAGLVRRMSIYADVAGLMRQLEAFAARGAESVGS